MRHRSLACTHHACPPTCLHRLRSCMPTHTHAHMTPRSAVAGMLQRIEAAGQAGGRSNARSTHLVDFVDRVDAGDVHAAALDHVNQVVHLVVL